MTREEVICDGLDLLDLPYIWGGKDPAKDEGLDCSGFARFVLGADSVPGVDAIENAQNMFDNFPRVELPTRACLVFYGADEQNITHVMLAISDQYCIGACHGDHTCVTIEAAQAKHAKVSIQPITYRSDIVGYTDPFGA